jgi:hypothetical protein
MRWDVSQRMEGRTTQPQEEHALTFPYRFAAALAVVALAVGGSSAFADSGHGGGDHHGRHHGRDNDRNRHANKVLEAGLVGSTPVAAGGPVLFGVNPGGAPWVIGDSRVKVRRDRLRVRGEGLLLINTGNPALDGTVGPVQKVTAAVFCNGSTTAAATSAPVDLDADGDFRVDADLSTPLPSPCLAPAVLIRVAQANGAPVANGAYIAASGA